MWQCVAARCGVLQSFKCDAPDDAHLKDCNTLQHAATHRNTLQHTATYAASNAATHTTTHTATQLDRVAEARDVFGAPRDGEFQ